MAGQSNPVPARSPRTGRVPTILGIITVLAAVLALSGAGRSASSDGLTSDVAFPLAPGFTELRWVGPTADARPSVASLNAAQPAGDRIVAVFAWVNATDEWLILRPDAPAFLSSLTELRTHNVYWFLVEVLPTPASAVSELDAWSPPNQLQQPMVAPHSTGIAAYDRDDWGDWIDADGDCEDTRAEVLIAESQIGVAFRASDPCAVDTGLWFGELTGLTFTLASDVDVDHHVPLANAHLSGGWAWSAAEREAYTNNLGNPDHLIAVDDSTNQSKGSRGPDAWRPPRVDYWCKYAVDWTVVKNNYALTATADEWTALQEMLNTCPGGSPTVLPSAPTSPTVLPSVPTFCGGASAQIVSLSKATTPEVVVISGSGDATGWYLISVTGNQRFDFPTGFQFAAHVEIHSASSAAGRGTILIWTAANIWNNAAEDDAELFDCDDMLVDHFDG